MSCSTHVNNYISTVPNTKCQKSQRIELCLIYLNMVCSNKNASKMAHGVLLGFPILAHPVFNVLSDVKALPLCHIHHENATIEYTFLGAKTLAAQQISVMGHAGHWESSLTSRSSSSNCASTWWNTIENQSESLWTWSNLVNNGWAFGLPDFRPSSSIS